MAYSHYFSFTPHTREFLAVWPQLVTDAGAILAGVREAGGMLAGPYGTGEPRAGGLSIMFNRSGGGWSQAFIFTIEPDAASVVASLGPTESFRWSFCSTNRSWDHDLAVTAILARAHQLAPSHVAIGSDGIWRTDWQAARTLLRRAFPTSRAIDADPMTYTVNGPRAVSDRHQP